jgi:hypothetical protein
MFRDRARLSGIVIAAVALPLGLVLWLRDPPPPSSPPPVARAPRVAPVVLPAAPAAPVVPAVPPPAPRPTASTVEVPCVSFAYDKTSSYLTDDTELLSDGQSLVLCRSSGACSDESGVISRPAARPATAVAAQVEADRVCTGTRCDALGPRVRAALKAGAPGDRHATTDHRLIVIGSADKAQIWTRTSDQRLAFPKPHHGGWDNEGDVLAAEVLGDHVLVSRAWYPEEPPPPPWAPARGILLDAHGAVTGKIATAASHRAPGSSIVDLGDDQFVVFNGAGGFSLVVHGKPTWFGDLSEWRGAPASGTRGGDPALARIEGQEVPIQAIALEAEPAYEATALDGRPTGRTRIKSFGYKWCDIGHDAGCHVGRIQIVFHVGLRGDEDQALRRLDDHVFPACK